MQVLVHMHISHCVLFCLNTQSAGSVGYFGAWHNTAQGDRVNTAMGHDT